MKSSESAPVSVPVERDAACNRNIPAGTPSLRGIQWTQALVLAVLFSVPALLCLHIVPVFDPDVWWHLRTGQWIVQHGAVPWTDPFSSFAAGKPWAAYSWLFEVLIFGCFQHLGLVGIVLFSAALSVFVTVCLYRMIGRLQGDFSFAVLLTATAWFSMNSLFNPRPWLFSILFFVLELDLLLQARKTGRMRPLLWLPVLFAVWANLHIQFIDGLVVLAIAATEAVLGVRWSLVRTRLRPGWLIGIFLACLATPLANPYGWRIYQTAYDLASQPGVLNQVRELSAMSFRFSGDWCVLMLAVAAACALARARRVALFETILLAFAFVVSFRSQRDLWVMVIAASAILASRLKGNAENRLRLTAAFAPFVALVTLLVIALGCLFLQVNNSRLRGDLTGALPVRAVAVVKENGWSGPLLNDYGWGGYLIWSLRLPVSIDGRAGLDGEPLIERSLATWGGQPDWASDPDLQKANLVIGPVTAPLTQLLRLDPRFQLVYEDKLAAVFLARKGAAAASVPASVPVGAAHRTGKFPLR